MDIEARRTRRDFLVAAGTAGAGLLLTGVQRHRGQAGGEESRGRRSGRHGDGGPDARARRARARAADLRGRRPPPRCGRGAAAGERSPTRPGRPQRSSRITMRSRKSRIVFLRLEKEGKLAPLTAVLRAQHKAGHDVTDEILKRLEPRPFNAPEKRRELAALMRGFARMYRPHYAREDTVVFPAFRQATTPGNSPGSAACSRNASGRSSGRKASRRSWRSWRRSKRRWASPTWRSSRRRAEAGATASEEY